MRETTATIAAPRALLSVLEVAGLIGCNRATVWRMISSGRFGPAVIHLGRMVRVRREEFDAWIVAGCPARGRWTWGPVARGGAG